MVSKKKTLAWGETGNVIYEYEFRGLSTDEKPIFKELGNGSVFLEIDTSKVFFFDKKNNIWKEA